MLRHVRLLLHSFSNMKHTALNLYTLNGLSFLDEKRTASWARAVKWLFVARLLLVKLLFWSNYCMPIMLQV